MAAGGPREDCHSFAREQLEIAEEVAAAFIAVLERLNPKSARCSCFAKSSTTTIPKSREWSTNIESGRPSCSSCTLAIARSALRFTVTPECRERVLKRFLAAVATCDRKRRGSIACRKKSTTPREDNHGAGTDPPPRRPNNWSTTKSLVGTFASPWGVLSEKYNILRQNQSDTRVVQHLREGCDSSPSVAGNDSIGRLSMKSVATHEFQMRPIAAVHAGD
jgi:hypothetical protein